MGYFYVVLCLLISTTLVTVRSAKSLSELTSDELHRLASTSRNLTFSTGNDDDGCGTHVPPRLMRSVAGSSNSDRGRSAESSSVFDTLGCAHCPTDGLCDNPDIRNLYMNRNEQLSLTVTWHLLPDSNGNYDVSLADLDGALNRLRESYSELGLNFTSKFVLYSTDDKPVCNGTDSPASFSDLRLARMASSQHPTSPHPYCVTPTDPHTLPHLYFHRTEITSFSGYTILSYVDPNAGAVPYGAHQRSGDILFYSIATDGPVEIVLYRFRERQSFLIEETPSTALSSFTLNSGINLEFVIPEDGDYFIWVYNRQTGGLSVVVQYVVSFFKPNCYSRDQFVSCFEARVEADSFNVVIIPTGVFQTSYRASGNALVASSVDGFAYFPFEVTSPWQVGLSFVAVEAIVNPSWTVLQHEIGHNLGLWHPSHGITETVQCQTQTNNEPCTGDQFRCLVQEKCIPVVWYCDGIADCENDRSDEPPNCQSLCYGPCQNPCRESNDFDEYIRDRVGDFCDDTPAAYTQGVPACANLAVTQLDRSTNLMATRRETVTSLTSQQKARAQCWLLNGAHQSFVSCRKEIRVRYDDYTDVCLSTFFQTWPVNATIFVECTADPCHYINPCENNGVCMSDYDTVSCDCTATGYCGLFCNVPANISSNCPFQQPTTSPPASSEPTSKALPTIPTMHDVSTVKPTATAVSGTVTTATASQSAPTVEPLCSSSTHGCCPDGVTVAGPYLVDCPGVSVGDSWQSAVTDYFASLEAWKSGC